MTNGTGDIFGSKPILIFAALFLVLMLSCTEEKKTVQSYGEGIVHSLENAEATKKSANIQLVRQSIQTYYAANAKYPADLDEVSRVSGVLLSGDAYMYDPATGSLTEKK